MRSKILLASALLLMGGCAADKVAPGANAPDAPAPVAAKPSGKTLGPGFVYFVKQDCGSNPRAVPLLTSLADAYKGKVQFTGVINADAAGLAAWKAEYPNDIEFQCDPGLDSMRKYEVTTSQTVLLLDADGKEIGRWGDFGRESLTSLNAKLAGEAKVAVANVNLSEAPDRKSYG